MVRRILAGRRQRMEFQDFLSGTPAREYVFQQTPYEQQIVQAAQLIKEADYILIGAGAGLSTAAGLAISILWKMRNGTKPSGISGRRWKHARAGKRFFWSLGRDLTLRQLSVFRLRSWFVSIRICP